jgi:hypothetical protein
VRISTGPDDAEEYDTGVMYLNSSDLELVYSGGNQTVGKRFNNIDIPPGMQIINAYLQFKVDETTSVDTNLKIEGQSSTNAPVFSSNDSNISSRLRTTSSVYWSPPPWNTTGASGPNQQTPDISPIIQEIINQTGWSSGNSLVLIISGTGERVAESFEGDSSGAPLLHIEYIESSVTSTPTSTPSATLPTTTSTPSSTPTRTSTQTPLTPSLTPTQTATLPPPTSTPIPPSPTSTPVPPSPTWTPVPTPTNLALMKQVTTSSYQKGTNSGDMAVDGNNATYWRTKKAVGKNKLSAEWISVDLGSQAELDRVVLNWHDYYATSYSIETSDDNSNWVLLYFTVNGDGGSDTIQLPGINARFLRLTTTAWNSGSQRNWLREFEVYGDFIVP